METISLISERALLSSLLRIGTNECSNATEVAHLSNAILKLELDAVVDIRYYYFACFTTSKDPSDLFQVHFLWPSQVQILTYCNCIPLITVFNLLLSFM